MEETRRFELVRAQDCDADTCMAVLSEGRAFQQEQGFVQWSDRYPALQDVVSDISLGTGFKLIDGGRIAAYVCLDPFGEEAYKHIKGAWHTSDPYIVIRRISFARDYAGRGLSGMLFALIDDVCRSRGLCNIRVDTAKENGRMQKALSRSGYSYCGTFVMMGIERLAYDRILA